MTTKFLTFIFAIAFGGICIAQAQSPTPAGSPKAATHRAAKKTQTTAEAAASPAASPAAKRGRKKAETATTAVSPSPAVSPAASPAAKRGRKKAETATTAVSPSPAVSPAVSPKGKRARTQAGSTAAASPVASPSPQFKLGDLFRPRGSAAASPAATAAPARGATTEVASNPPAPGGGHGLVWVNTESHIYHREGSRFYGTTKKGKYVTEADAVKEGNRAAMGRE
jgi:hypothetical protein